MFFGQTHHLCEGADILNLGQTKDANLLFIVYPLPLPLLPVCASQNIPGKLEENWMVICHLISKKFSIVFPFKQLTREVACCFCILNYILLVIIKFEVQVLFLALYCVYFKFFFCSMCTVQISAVVNFALLSCKSALCVLL